MIKMKNYYRMVGMILLIVAVVICPSTAWAQAASSPWTTVGSAGTVDDGDVSPTMLAVFSGPTVTVSNSVETATLDIRYNIVAVGGLLGDDLIPEGEDVLITIRFRDNGASAQVIVKLQRYDLTTAITTTLWTFDSNNEPLSNSFQLADKVICDPNWVFDFSDYCYYIEAALKKFNSSGNPGLSHIWLQYVTDSVMCP